MKNALLLLLSLASISLHAQTVLNPGNTLEADLKNGDVDVYTFESGENHFLYGFGNQLTVDIVITLKGPDGETIRSFDGPGRGPEPFTLELEQAGTYTLEITPFEEEEGDYTIAIHILEPIAEGGEAYVDQRMSPYATDNSPGATIAVVEKDEIVWHKSYGMAELTWGIELEPQMLTNLGSTSKQFTAFAIGLLEDQGKLSMDDDVRKYFPEFPEFGETVTIANLVYHTSGYREILNTMALTGMGFNDVLPAAASVSLIENQPELQAPPGTEWNYCNTAYDLLAQIVAKVTEEDFDDWMKANIFEPLGMTSTLIKSRPGQIIENSARSYSPGFDGFDYTVHNHGVAGGTNIYSNVFDLVHWVRNFRTGELGGEDLRERRFRSDVLKNGDTTEYAYGIFVDQQGPQKRIHHGGADAGYRTMVVYYPGLDVSVFALSNHGSFNARMAYNVAEAFYPEAFEETEDAQTTEVETEGTEFDIASFNPETFDDYSGDYALDAMPSFVVSFRRDGDQFYTQATGQPELEIFPISENEFELRVVDAHVEFHREDDGAVNTLTLHQGGANTATRVAEEPEEVNLEEFAGRYLCNELEVIYTIAYEDSALVSRHRRMNDISLNHAQGDSFSAGFPLGAVDFIRDDQGEVVAFTVGVGRTRGVRFDRMD